ncbi:MAG: DUF2183 domain-containing protein [Deltaproteobacteria bacterium]|nr:DUF2183 domain-containing protein [Deltaproteobacteria bacterium]
MPNGASAKKKGLVVVVYGGFGTTSRARLWGRVLKDKGLDASRPGESFYRKLKRNVQALESDEIPGAEVELKVAGKVYRLKADHEGLLRLDLSGPLPVGHHPVSAVLHDGRPYRVEVGRLSIWPASPGLAVVSDVDDTVLKTGVTRKTRMVWKVLTRSAQELETYPGAPALYRALARQAYPIVFVSGSPVNLYSKLREFFRLKRFPSAPLLLKNLGTSPGSDALRDQRAYKLRRIAEVLELLPGYRVLLIGDTGESDPEIYREVSRQYPRRVAATLIHRVTDAVDGEARYRGQVVFAAYPEARRHLVGRRLLPEPSPAEDASEEAR